MRIVLRVFLPFALGYTLVYLVRVINAVAGEPIARDLDLSAGDLGLLTSLFFAGFGLAQLPLGVLMDRFGPRRVEAVTLLLLAAGAALFWLAADFTDLAIGRFLMGVGASMCLMAPFTAYRQWFAPERLAFVNAWHLSFGALGGALGGVPTDALVGALGWQPVFALIALLTLVVSAAILFVVPAEREPRGRPRLVALSRQIRLIVASEAFWKIAPLAATTQAVLISIPSLWMGPWLRQVAALPGEVAATWLSVYSLALIVGFVGTGWLMNRARSPRAAERVVLAGAAAFVAMQVAIAVLPPALATPLWLPYGAVGAATALTYALLVTCFPLEMAGRVNTTLNFALFVGAFLIQWLFGVLLDLFPDGAGGYRPEGYALGFLILAGLQLAAFVPWLVLKASPASARPAAASGEP